MGKRRVRRKPRRRVVRVDCCRERLAGDSPVARVECPSGRQQQRDSRGDIADMDLLAAYWPWVSLATTMLDNYADQDDDVANGNHNYFTHYRDSPSGVRRLCGHIARAAQGTRDLPNGERHAVIVSAMVAMYISKECDGKPQTRRARRALTRSGGSLVRVLVPVLRAWRIAYGQRAT